MRKHFQDRDKDLRQDMRFYEEDPTLRPAALFRKDLEAKHVPPSTVLGGGAGASRPLPLFSKEPVDSRRARFESERVVGHTSPVGSLPDFDDESRGLQDSVVMSTADLSALFSSVLQAWEQLPTATSVCTDLATTLLSNSQVSPSSLYPGSQTPSQPESVPTGFKGDHISAGSTGGMGSDNSSVPAYYT